MQNYVIYDIECLKNVFTLDALDLTAKRSVTFEISERKNNLPQLLKWVDYLSRNKYEMVGFNNFHYDYPLLHHLLSIESRHSVDNFGEPDTDNQVTPWDKFTATAFKKSVQILRSSDRFEHTIWDNDQIVHQIDLFKIHHFDNKSKSTSLKRLQFNMRMRDIVEFEPDFKKELSVDLIGDLVEYNRHDTVSTLQFFKATQRQLRFRQALVKKFGPKVLNYNDTKIGESSVVSTLEELVGVDKLYVWEKDLFTGRKKRSPRQTPREIIGLKHVIFHNVNFTNSTFKKVLKKFRSLHIFVINGKFHWSDRMDYPKGYAKIQALKGYATSLKKQGKTDEAKIVREKIKELGKIYVDYDITAEVDGFEFVFGKGGLHGSRKWSSYRRAGDMIIRDVDVTSFYPSIAIAYGMKPDHLPDEYKEVYESQLTLRKTYPKGTVENMACKLALNGVYGKSNSSYSIFYDPLYTITTVINGQLFLCMLWEKLRTIPTIEIIQANTDGITYYIDKKYVPMAEKCEKEWEKLTRVRLEPVEYESIFLRDVNNYVARKVGSDSVKATGCYAYRNLYYDNDVPMENVQWHKNHSMIIIRKAAEAYLLDGTDYREFIMNHKSVWDFFLCTNVNRSSNLLYGDKEIQRNSRYLITNEGKELTKLMLPLSGKTDMRRIGVNVGEVVQVYNTVTSDNADDYDIKYEFYIDECAKILKGFITDIAS